MNKYFKVLFIICCFIVFSHNVHAYTVSNYTNKCEEGSSSYELGNENYCSKVDLGDAPKTEEKPEVVDDFQDVPYDIYLLVDTSGSMHLSCFNANECKKADGSQGRRQDKVESNIIKILKAVARHDADSNSSSRVFALYLL